MGLLMAHPHLKTVPCILCSKAGSKDGNKDQLVSVNYLINEDKSGKDLGTIDLIFNFDAKLDYKIWCLIFVVVAIIQSQSCSTLCDSMDCSMPSSCVLDCLPEFAQIHVH